MTLILAGPVGAVAHAEGASHPERRARIDAVMRGVDDLHLGDELVSVPVPVAPRKALVRVHPEAYLDWLERHCAAGGGSLDEDTFARADSYEAACRAAGASLAALDALGERGEGVAFVPVRPPGHHAGATTPMGFCLLNNVAVAAASLTARGERVLIVDWDVHHGNGTQEIFYDDPNVLYVSTHQSPLYPGTGSPREVGTARALGLTVNLPVPPGATGDVVRRAIEEVAAPVVDAFGPDWVLVSCGFDAHRADPLGELALSSGDFAALARLVASFAPHAGRVALFLEGGYSDAALRASTTAVLGALLDVQVDAERETAGGPGADHVVAGASARRVAIDAIGERF